MVHIYGHSWPVRWGKAGEKRNIQVYSNCDSAELFLNGVSMGIKRRDSQDFPAAGLRWDVTFASGKNTLRAVAIKGGVKISDEISLNYQTEPWGKPAELRLQKKEHKDNVITLQATLFDAQGVLCLDSSVFIHFSLAGAGRLIDNMGTASASRELQLSNGRAEISLIHNGGCRFEARCEGLPAATLNL
jgi:beta-galactosidase